MSNLRVGYSAKFFKHIPSDWGLIELKKLVKPDRKITYGIVQPGQYDPNGILLIRGQDYMTGWAERGSFFKVSPALHQKFKRSTTRSGDVLISIAGYTGTVAVVPSWIQEANLTQTTARICCKPDLMDGLYLSYFLQSDDGKLQSKRYTKGSAQEGLNLEDVEKFLISVPPLPEQQKIATILSSVDDVIEKTRAQIDKLKDLKTGMMQELLTKGIGHTEFKDSPVGRIPTSWKVIPLEELCSKVSVGIASSTTHAYCSSGVPLLRNQNILPSGIRRTDILYISQKFSEENSSKKIHTGDVITVRTGYPGISAVVPEEFNNCHSFTTLISRPKPAVLNSHYLSLVINSDYGKNFVVGGQAGGAQQNLNATTLKIFPVILPPLREQVAIFEIVNSVSEKISLSIKKLGAMNSVKKALMQDLLTGKVRVNLTDKESAVV